MELDRQMYDFLNDYTAVNGAISYLSNKAGMTHLFSFAERFENKNNSVGRQLFEINCEDSKTLPMVLQIINESFNTGNVSLSREFFIDSEFLSDQRVIDFIRENYDKGNIKTLNIIGENYTLDEITYNNIRFLDTIYVNGSSVNTDNVVYKTSSYSSDIGINNDNKVEYSIFIKNNPSDNDINEIITLFNGISSDCDKKIHLKFYNPELSMEIINRFDKLGLGNEVGFDILGYPLTESSEAFNKKSNRKIDVTYSCCHDLLGLYCREPFVANNYYLSELEPGGKTDLETYIKMLEFIENFQNSVSSTNLASEKTMMAYQYLNNNYYYDLDSGRTKDYAATRDVDKILDTDEIVCVGYANLLSIMCRRVGVPMFTYGAPNHRMNIARIVDKDETGTVVVDKICTFDPTNDCGYYKRDSVTGEKIKHENKDSYTFFGLDPEKWLYDSKASHITLANALSIQRDDLEKNLYTSLNKYNSCYLGGYCSLSYMYAMLHLMGYKFDYNNTEIFDAIASLQQENKIGPLSRETILNAIRNIERRNNPNMSEEEFTTHINRINQRALKSIDNRASVFNAQNPRIKLNNLGNEVIDVATYKTEARDFEHVDIRTIDIGPIYYENIDRLNVSDGTKTSEQKVEPVPVPAGPTSPNNGVTENDLSEEYIPGTNIRKPRARNINESDEEYVTFLEHYYNQYFFNNRNSIGNTPSYVIIQDLPIYSQEEQQFETPGMTEEEINASRIKLGF